VAPTDRLPVVRYDEGAGVRDGPMRRDREGKLDFADIAGRAGAASFDVAPIDAAGVFGMPAL